MISQNQYQTHYCSTILIASEVAVAVTIGQKWHPMSSQVMAPRFRHPTAANHFTSIGVINLLCCLFTRIRLHSSNQLLVNLGLIHLPSHLQTTKCLINGLLASISTVQINPPGSKKVKICHEFNFGVTRYYYSHFLMRNFVS